MINALHLLWIIPLSGVIGMWVTAMCFIAEEPKPIKNIEGKMHPDEAATRIQMALNNKNVLPWLKRKKATFEDALYIRALYTAINALDEMIERVKHDENT